MNSSLRDALLQYWGAQPGLQLRPPAGPDEIYAFEQKYQVRLPEELRAFYLAADGFAPPDDQDQNGFSFWSLARVCPWNSYEDGRWSSEKTAECYVFADYLSVSWAFAFRLTSESLQVPVCIVGTATGTPRWIADSFEQFVELYVRDDEVLYKPNDVSPLN